jgi:hypothetical protein
MIFKKYFAPFWFLILAGNSLGADSSHPKIEKFSDGDYGILAKSDKMRKSQRPLMWRCFRTKDVKVKYRRWPFTNCPRPVWELGVGAFARH